MESLDSLPNIQSTPLPDFDASTALPNGDFFPSRTDFEARFVNGSVRRTTIYNGWNRHRSALKDAGLPDSARQLLNGSFTTTKNDPGDIDLAVEVPKADELFNDESKLNPVVALLRGPKMKTNYECDAYPIFIFPPEHPDYSAVTLNGIRYWTKWFGRTRTGECKGRVWATVGGLQ